MFTAAAASPCTVHTRRRASAAGEGVRKAGGQGTRPGTSRAPGHNHPTTSPQASKLSYTDLSKLSKKAAASPCTVYIHEGNTKAGNSCGRRWVRTGRAPGHTGRAALAGHRGTNAQSSNQHFAKSIVHRSFSRIRAVYKYNLVSTILYNTSRSYGIRAGLSTNITNPSRTVSEPGPVTA